MLLLYSTIRLAVADLASSQQKLVWLLLAETSVGPAVISTSDFEPFVPLLKSLLALFSVKGGAAHVSLCLQLVELVDARRLRVFGNTDREAIELELDEQQADELASLLEAIAAHIRAATQSEEGGEQAN